MLSEKQGQSCFYVVHQLYNLFLPKKEIHKEQLGKRLFNTYNKEIIEVLKNIKVTGYLLSVCI